MITLQRETIRHKALEEDITALNDQDQRKKAFFATNWASNRWVASVPSAGNECTNSEIWEMAANYFGTPSPACKPFAGRNIPGSRNKRLDAYGNNLTCLKIEGWSGWQQYLKQHNGVKNVMWDLGETFSWDGSCEPFGLFSAHINRLDAFMLQNRQQRQAIIPDFLVRGSDERQYLGDVKTLHSSNNTYRGADARREPAGAVNRRQKAVHKAYVRAAKKADVKYNNIPPGLGGGPVENKLGEYGRVRGYVFGAHGEASSDVDEFIDMLAEFGSERTWRDMGCRSQKEAGAVIKSMARRAIGIEAARGAARLKLARITVMSGDMKQAASRRRRQRYGYRARRAHQRGLSGFRHNDRYGFGGGHGRRW